MRNDYKIRPRPAFKGGGIALRGLGAAFKGGGIAERGMGAEFAKGGMSKKKMQEGEMMIDKELYNNKKMKKGGKAFPDLTGDGKVTFKDVLKGRGVIKKKGGMIKKGKK